MKISLLKQKDFFLLVFGKFISNIGSQLQSFALSLYVLSISGSAAKFASVLAVSIIPKLILAPIAGVLADWFDRKKIMVSLDILSGIVVGIFAVIYGMNGKLNMISIYILSISLSLISVVFQPVTSTILPSIVTKKDLVDANGINSFCNDLGSLFAPAIGGVLMSLLGMQTILILNSISFILSGISEAFINVPKNNKKPDEITIKKFLNDFKEGIEFIRNEKFIFTVLAIAFIVNFAFSPMLSVGLTYISKQIVKISDFQYGVLESFQFISMLIAPFITGSIYNKFHHGKVEFYTLFLVGILIIIFSIIPSNIFLNMFNTNTIPYIGIIVIMFLIGILLTTFNITINTIMQENIPLDMMGRIMSVSMLISMCAIPLGQMIFGYLYDKIPASICTLISAVIIIITILSSKNSLFNNGQTKAAEKQSTVQ